MNPERKAYSYQADLLDASPSPPHSSPTKTSSNFLTITYQYFSFPVNLAFQSRTTGNVYVLVIEGA